MKTRKIAAVALAATALSSIPPALAQTAAPSLEIVASLPVRPGNVAVATDGRVFATIHPLGNPKIQLTEIKNGEAVPFPSAALQKNGATPSAGALDTPLGIVVDKVNRLWTIDIGLELGKARLWSFDITSGKVLETIELPLSVAPKGSFVQDVAIDEANGWAYLADIGPAGLIVVDLKSKVARRFEAPVLQSEDKDMVIDGKVINFGGKPARVGINPVTLSADRETLYFGAMNGTAWYGVPAKLFRDGADDKTIVAAIRKVGDKPISDGAATDAAGNHYFTDLQEHGISRLGADGRLTQLLRDDRLQWPDNVAVAPQGWLYISVNQLTTTPAFTGGGDTGKPPYFIYRFKAQ